MMKSLLHRGNKQSSKIRLHDDSGSLISSPLNVAKKFNNYLLSTAPNLKAEINTRRTSDTGE